MKNIIAITVIALSLFTKAFAFDGGRVLPFNPSRAFVYLKAEVSEKIIQRFNAEYTGATNITWEQTDDYNKVSYVWKGTVMSTFYDETGDWVATAQVVKCAALPEGSTDAIADKYKGYVQQLAVRLDRPYHKQPSYFVFVTNGDKRILLEVRAKGWIRRANVTYL